MCPNTPFICIICTVFASVTPAVSRISVGWSAASLRPLQQPEEEEEEAPRSRPGAVPKGPRRRRRSGRLLTSNLRSCSAGSARPAVEAQTALNTGRYVVCLLLLCPSLAGRAGLFCVNSEVLRVGQNSCKSPTNNRSMRFAVLVLLHHYLSPLIER